MMFLGLFILLLTFYLSFFCDIINHKTSHELAYVYDLVWFSVYLPSPTTHIVSTLYADTFVLDTTHNCIEQKSLVPIFKAAGTKWTARQLVRLVISITDSG